MKKSGLMILTSALALFRHDHRLCNIISVSTDSDALKDHAEKMREAKKHEQPSKRELKKRRGK